MTRATHRRPTGFLENLAAFCYRRRGTVVLAWIAILVGFSVLAATVGGSFRTQFNLPGSESQEAIDMLQSHGFSDRAGAQGQIVVRAEGGIDRPEVQAAFEELLAEIEAGVPDVTIVSPFSEEGARQVSPDRTIAFAEVNLAERSQEEYQEAADIVKEFRSGVAVEGMQVELGGDVFAEWEEPSSELIGILFAMVILIVAFGSLLAMGLPIIAALFGIGTGFALISIVTNWVDMPDFTSPVAAMIGIGVGIDYALFIVTRYRTGLHDGLDPEEAVRLAVNTAGRAVLFAGTTVVLSLLGIYFMGLSMMVGMAIGASLAVLMVMLASVTLVPAILAFAGRNIDRFGLPHRRHKGGNPRESFWHRWSRAIQQRPWPFAIGAAAFLVLLTLPVFSLRLGFSDGGNRPETDSTRRAYDLLAEAFGPGFNGTLLIATLTPNGADDVARLESELLPALGETPNVAQFSPVIPNEAGTAAIIQVVPGTGPQDERTNALVHDLRDNVIPSAVAGTQLAPKVGGIAAGTIDFSEFTMDRLPIFFAAVLALSFILLMAVFRSVLVPLKAMVMNLLSIGAAYGLLVIVFQWGFGLSLLGVGKEGPIDAWIPMMLFAIVFGLSMDYEVFLLSRIREEYDRTGDNGTAVADGLAATARVISAAALIMVFVFGSFVLGNDRSLKIAGLGLAAAVAIDATVVRLILVPATMELLGDRNWWIPRWLDRTLPNVHVEVPQESATEPSASAAS